MGNINQMLSAFEKMPRAMANVAHEELTSHELMGNPINRVTGKLAGSWGVTSEKYGVAVLKQINDAANYAPRVMVPVSIARAGKPALTLLMDRLQPRFDKAVFSEFQRIERVINAGGNYRFDAGRFEASI